MKLSRLQYHYMQIEQQLLQMDNKEIMNISHHSLMYIEDISPSEEHILQELHKSQEPNKFSLLVGCTRRKTEEVSTVQVAWFTKENREGLNSEDYEPSGI